MSAEPSGDINMILVNSQAIYLPPNPHSFLPYAQPPYDLQPPRGPPTTIAISLIEPNPICPNLAGYVRPQSQLSGAWFVGLGGARLAPTPYLPHCCDICLCYGDWYTEGAGVMYDVWCL